MGHCIFRSAVYLSFAAILASCGGGGGGSGTNTGPVAVAVAVEGRIQFESIPFSSKGLEYASTVMKPARAVIVRLVDMAGNSIVTGTTDANGQYKLIAPRPVPVRLQVYSVMSHANDSGSNWSVTVADNTHGGALWAAQSETFTPGDTPGIITTTLGSGWKTNAATGRPVAAEGRAAAPFAILDTIYESQEKIRSALPGATFKPLIVMWSPDNRPSSSFDPPTGQIGGSRFINFPDAPTIYLVGKANVDTDEYDGSVITHEWAHYFQQFFSRNDSIGGSHGTGQQLDRTLAFSEGLATAWSGIVLNRAHYIDTTGLDQASVLLQDMENGPSTGRGWFNEDSIAHVIWKLDKWGSAAPIIQALTGPLRTQAAPVGIHAFNAALLKVNTTAGAAFGPILASQGIFPGADAWGTGETNSGRSTVAIPMSRLLTLETPLAASCVSRELDLANVGNKLGGYAYFRVSILKAGAHFVSVVGPFGSHPLFSIADGVGVINRSVVNPLFSNSASAGAYLSAGDYLLRLRDEKSLTEKTCFIVQLTQGVSP